MVSPPSQPSKRRTLSCQRPPRNLSDLKEGLCKNPLSLSRKQVTISTPPWILPFEKENYPNYLLRDGPRHRLGRRVGPDLHLHTGLVDRALRLNNISLEIPLSFKSRANQRRCRREKERSPLFPSSLEFVRPPLSI